jgi:hypothetical protein
MQTACLSPSPLPSLRLLLAGGPCLLQRFFNKILFFNHSRPEKSFFTKSFLTVSVRDEDSLGATAPGCGPILVVAVDLFQIVCWYAVSINLTMV